MPTVERHPALQALIELELPAGDYALFGSGPLLARGWVESVGDIDVLARGAAWERALALGTLKHLGEWNVDIVEIGDTITVGRAWAIGWPDVDELIDTAELVGEVPCVRLEHVEAYKRLADRPKDREHLARIRAERVD